MIEKRKFERNNLIKIVHYSPSTHTTDAVLNGVTQNFSYSGLCFITRHAVERRQEILLKSRIVPNAKTAVVRWHKDIGNGNYKVGLEIRR